MFGYSSISGGLAGFPDMPQQAQGVPVDVQLRTDPTYAARIITEARYDTTLDVEPG